MRILRRENFWHSVRKRIEITSIFKGASLICYLLICLDRTASKSMNRDGSPLLKIKNTAKLFLIFFFCCFRVRNVSRVLLKSKRSCRQFYHVVIPDRSDAINLAWVNQQSLFTGTKCYGNVIWRHDRTEKHKPDSKYNFALVSLTFKVICSQRSN